MSKFKARLHEKMKEANMMPKLDLPVVIGRLESLNRFDIDPVFNGEFIELEERKESDGSFVKWDDVKKLINGLKTDNAL